MGDLSDFGLRQLETFRKKALEPPLRDKLSGNSSHFLFDLNVRLVLRPILRLSGEVFLTGELMENSRQTTCSIRDRKRC